MKDTASNQGLAMEQSGIYKAKNTERLIPESQLREAVKEILSEMLGVNTTLQPQREWYDTDPAYSMLGLDSPKHLRKMVTLGILRVGKDEEVRDLRSPGARLPRYQFHITKCLARLSLPPAKRKGKAA
ncbi:MAG: hypothetical protein HWQ36_26335 [Nostoc sp. NMS2]|uniref:hypothetical protein n=1 Tax=Nostoc sp. NMS2 TaxID=2815389 RepID=UPI0025DB3F40|nr:hypothetical protein [Nostoc sp. NMS2]MBN3993907.1 hypothetical protein [Nostoc sp. NMS2]